MTYTFQTVDDPNSNVNEVTAINQLSKIIGVYGAGSGSTIPQSYSSEPPYVKFRSLNEPGSQGTFAAGTSSNKMIVGYVLDPNSLSGMWGFIRINGLWTLLADSKEGTGANAVTEILGINDSESAVGFYVNTSGNQVPFALNVAQETFADLAPPGATNAQATGVDGKGDITGWETSSTGTTGWFLQAGTYYPFSYSGGVATYALSLNWSDQVVGYYLDSKNVKHGFILTGPTKGGAEQIWQTVDAPNGANGTVITGINNHHDICGYYVDASGIQHGFVAVPKPS